MNTANSNDAQLLAALRFAADKHRKQRRKDAEATPYINHPIAVAELLARVGKVEERAALLAAILHDTVEDTATTTEEIERHFGPAVRKLVEEVTDDKILPKAERKRLQVEHGPQLSALAKQVKLADKICNVSEMSPSQPVEWDVNRKREYLDWAERVVSGLRGHNAELEALFDRVLEERRDALGPSTSASRS